MSFARSDVSSGWAGVLTENRTDPTMVDRAMMYTGKVVRMVQVSPV